MFGGNVQGREIVPFILDLGAFGMGEAHASEDVTNFVDGSAENVPGTEWRAQAGLGHVDRRPGGLGRSKR